MVGLSRAPEVGGNYFDVARELPEQLAAGAARGRRALPVRHDGYGHEFPLSFGDRFPQRDSLRADRQPVGRVLHVATCEDPAVRSQQRRANLEAGVRRVSVLARFGRPLDQIFPSPSLLILETGKSKLDTRAVQPLAGI